MHFSATAMAGCDDGCAALADPGAGIGAGVIAACQMQFRSSSPQELGVRPQCVKAIAFLQAAGTLWEFDSFMRSSALRTLSGHMRESVLAGEYGATTRGLLASALDAHLATFEEVGLNALTAILPCAVEGSGMTSAQLMDVLRTISEGARSVGSGGGHAAAAPQAITVRVSDGQSVGMIGVDEGDLAEAHSLARDVDEVLQTAVMTSGLRTIGQLAAAGNMTEMFVAVEATGAPLRRMLHSTLPDQLAKLLTHNQCPGDIMQMIHTIRYALARRQWVSVHGLSAGEASSDQKKAIAALSAGKLGAARPALLCNGGGASTRADPLSFLDKLSAGSQDGALFEAFFHIVAHLQVAFPTQAAQTMRFFVSLTKWIRKHRGLGAS